MQSVLNGYENTRIREYENMKRVVEKLKKEGRHRDVVDGYFGTVIENLTTDRPIASTSPACCVEVIAAGNKYILLLFSSPLLLTPKLGPISPHNSKSATLVIYYFNFEEIFISFIC